MDFEYNQALREALVSDAIGKMNYHSCTVENQNLSVREKSDQLIMFGFLFYWELAWKWYYRKIISPWDDWNTILNKAPLSEESVQAGVTTPWVAINDRVATANKLSVVSLAKYMASLHLKKMSSDIKSVKQGRLLRDQIRLGAKDEEISEAYRLFQEHGGNLVDCLMDDDIPTIACPWPRVES